MKKSKILGIDPGTLKTGFAILEIVASKIKLVSSGVIKTDPKSLMHERYHTIFKEIREIIKEFRPTILSIETQFVQKNVASAMKISMARGAVLIAAAEQHLEVFEYSPTAAKKAISTNATASKEQIMRMIQSLLNLKEPIKSDDQADAICLALCHHFKQKRITYV